MGTAASARRTLVFVVDADADLRALVEAWLVPQGYQVRGLPDGEACLKALPSALPSVVLLGLDPPGLGGAATLARIRAHYRHLPVIVLAADRSVETVVDLLHQGARDFLPKPIDEGTLLASVASAVENFELAQRVAVLEREHQAHGFPGLLGTSAAMRQVVRQIEQAASADHTVFVHGEPGSGKELVARAIHEHSARRGRPFMALDCAALPEALQESELFGQEQGSVTSATQRRRGRFEEVDGGTLFLAEVGALTAGAQVRLLRVLQERAVQPVGSSQDAPVDFRLVTATHRDLLDEVKQGRFREDLAVRLLVFEIELPALRAREGDVPTLVEHFLQKHGPRLGRPVPTVAPDAMACLVCHPWPGNVRELENAVQRALVSCDGHELRVSDLPAQVVAVEGSPVPPPSAPAPAPLVLVPPVAGAPPVEFETLTLEQVERELIRRALIRHQGNRSAVAQALGIGRTTLYRKLHEYGFG